MFLNFFIELRNIKVPVSLREYLSLLDCLDKNVISFKVENFYYLSRASLIKNEKHIDRFDLVFSNSARFSFLTGLDGGREVLKGSTCLPFFQNL